MSEAPTSLLREPRAATDSDIWDYFRFASGSEPIYERLALSKTGLEGEKQRFFASNFQSLPDLRPTVDSDLVDAEQRVLQGVKELVPEATEEPWLRDAYRWRINEDIAGIRMLGAAARGDMNRFRRYNRFIFGKPDESVFAATCDWFRGMAERADNEAAEAVLTLVPDMGGNQADLLPSEATFQAIRREHYRESGYYSLLLAGVELPDDGKVAADVGDVALAQVLHNLNSDYSISDAAGSTWSVAHHESSVKRPAGYDLPVKRFVGLGLGHEIGSHLLEYENGRKSGLNLLSSGLDRTVMADEGRAVIREQVPYESFEEFSKQRRWHDILRRHFVISLAEGLAGEEMNFAEVFKAVNAIDRFWERSKEPAGDAAALNDKANQRSWDLLARALKGTDGHGGAYLKDKVYLEGNIACWRLAESHPEMIALGDLGKFDITNPRHIAILQAAGILPREDNESNR